MHLEERISMSSNKSVDHANPVKCTTMFIIEKCDKHKSQWVKCPLCMLLTHTVIKAFIISIQQLFSMRSKLFI